VCRNTNQQVKPSVIDFASALGVNCGDGEVANAGAGIASSARNVSSLCALPALVVTVIRTSALVLPPRTTSGWRRPRPAWSRGRRPPFGGGHEQALVGVPRGALCLETGYGPGAEEALGRAYAAAVESNDMPILATVAVAVAGVAALYGRHRDMAALLGAAARLRGAHDRTDPHVHAEHPAEPNTGRMASRRHTRTAGSWRLRRPWRRPIRRACGVWTH
jgi:hypothetical protein